MLVVFIKGRCFPCPVSTGATTVLFIQRMSPIKLKQIQHEMENSVSYLSNVDLMKLLADPQLLYEYDLFRKVILIFGYISEWTFRCCTLYLVHLDNRMIFKFTFISFICLKDIDCFVVQISLERIWT